ncbi:MAG: hypothetical protein NTW28_30150 [Candidatus Solibacter sp.]|nr:hypothetical protein [Candidatus Solibacter sp.]
MRITVVALIALAAAAFAQGPPPGRGGRGRMGFDGSLGRGGPPIESGPGILRAGVKNAPFSADVITESSHTLADGNHIRQTVTSKVYRDGEGRIRREQAVKLNGLAPDANMQQMVFINDSVAGVSYSLNAKDRTGTKFVRSGEGRGSQRLSPDPSGRGAGVRSRESSAGGPGGRGMDRRTAAEQNLKTESLGRQTIEGVQAEGSRITMTIPAGQAGNDLPIHIVMENWFSPDLQTTVLSKHSDPRNGETSTRLTNISRSEPARILFEAPADYRVSESSTGMPRARGGAGQAKQ